MIAEFYQRLIWPSLLFIWLRWRIRFNQMSHSSKLAQALTVVGILFVVLSVGSIWIGGVLAGVFIPPRIGLENNFLMWDALVLIALLSWAIHVLNETQRGDPISMDRILHLPVSPGQAFVVNYLSSLGSTVFLMTAGGFLGVVFGSLFSVGWRAGLFLFPTIAFLFSMTAITYWLQGWLATIMENPRKRQTVLVMIPVVIVAVSQIPIQFVSWNADRNKAKPSLQTDLPQPSEPNQTLEERAPEAMESIPRSKESAPDAVSIDVATTDPNTSETIAQNAVAPDSKEAAAEIVTSTREDRNQANQARLIRWRSIASFANLVLPPLWIVSAVECMSSGTVLPLAGLLLTVLMTLMGAQALRYSHRSTLKYWRGELSNSSKSKPTEKSDDKRRNTNALLEYKLPWVSEETSAVTTMTWATMLRAPEVKMFLLLPMIAPVVLLIAMRIRILSANEYLRVLLICGMSVFVLLIASGIVGNMFGYDRAGFRTFAISGIERRRILLGRNIAYFPLVFGVTTLSAVAFGIAYSIPAPTVFLMVLMIVSMLPLYFLLMNLMSVLTPFALASGSIQPKHFEFMTVIINVTLSMLLPMIMAFAMLPLGVKLVWETALPEWRGVPIGLMAACITCSVSFWAYRMGVAWQGDLLARREKEILRVVTSKVE